MRSSCPISYSLDFFGDKWSLLIIRDLIFGEKKFFKDFLSSNEGIATNILSDRLKKLEAIGVIESKVFEELKTQKEYSLTQKGIDLLPVLLEMMVWSKNYEPELNVTQEFIDLVKTNRKEVIETIVQGLN